MLSSNVVVEKGAEVIDSVIMAGAVIKAGAKVTYSIIDENTVVEAGAVVGEDRNTASGIAVLGRNITIAAGVKVAAGQILDKDYKGE